MPEFSPSKSHSLETLSTSKIEEICNVSLTILQKRGVMIKNSRGLNLLKDFGCEVDFDKKVVRISQHLVEECMSKAPSIIRLYGREGRREVIVGENNTIFNPGSTAVNFIDHETGIIRKPLSKDLVELVMLADVLEHIHAQSTALVPSDVPKEICDLYRLYLVLKNSPKPIVTGAFTKQGLIDMKRLLEAVVGGKEKLAIKPMAIFDVCPSSPLMWSDISCENLIDCASSSLPAEIISAPQMGATSPVTLAGTLAQSNAEFLSGLVISQITNPGAPVIYGGSPTTFDMKYCTSCSGTIESMMLACAYSQIGKHYGLPTHAYLGLSDSKIIDAQSGMESSLGIILGVLAGINVISGPGMFIFESCQSLEKLVVDNEICGMALRLSKGVIVNNDSLSSAIISRVGPGGHYLAEGHTRKWLEREHFMPSDVIDRLTVNAWKKQGSKNTTSRAREIVDRILRESVPARLPTDIESKLKKVLNEIMARYNIKSVPIL
jgi:trimethylamine--corrinoid protein Co-methyltransferase